jgi:hypothetical protein
VGLMIQKKMAVMVGLQWVHLDLVAGEETAAVA